MAIKKIGVVWVVYEGDTDKYVSQHRCRAEAEAVDKKHSPVVEVPENPEEKIPFSDLPEPAPTETEQKEPDGYPCPECDFVAKNLSGLRAHSRVKHPEVEGE